MSNGNELTLIIGGGIAGLTVSARLVDAGLNSIIIESSSKLGGHLGEHYSLFPHHVKARELLDEALGKVTDNPKIEILIETRLKDISGGPGAFKAVVETGGEGSSQTRELEASAVVIATGFESMDSNLLHEYSYTLHKNVLTGLEFETMLNDAHTESKKLTRPSDGAAPKNAAVIMCTGSRDEKFNEFCCEVGCRAGLNHAYHLKEMFGNDISVYVCYIDIRATGKDNEIFYRSVRESDVHFIRGRPSEISTVDDNTAKFVIFDQVTHKLLQVESDLIILETGLMPRPGQADLNDMLKLETDDTGFLAAKDYFQPSHSSAEGIYLAGSASGPRDLPGTISNATMTAYEIIKKLRH